MFSKCSICTTLSTNHALMLKKKVLLFIYHLFSPQCFHLSAPEADGGVLIGCFPPGFFSVVESGETINSGTAHQPTHPHREGPPGPTLFSRVGQFALLWGSDLPSCGRQPLTEWQPSLIQRRDLNLGSKQHLLLKHARSASMGNFSPFFRFV